MLIKERLPIPIERHESNALRWLVLLGVALLTFVSLRDFSKLNFGLDISQLVMELGMVLLIVITPAMLIVGLATILSRVLNLSARNAAILTAVFLAPLAIFLVSAHLFMSSTLSTLKLNFRYASQFDRPSDELSAIVRARDKQLAENGYARLGTWRASGHDGDCVAIYLFVGAF